MSQAEESSFTPSLLWLDADRDLLALKLAIGLTISNESLRSREAMCCQDKSTARKKTARSWPRAPPSVIRLLGNSVVRASNPVQEMSLFCPTFIVRALRVAIL